VGDHAQDRRSGRLSPRPPKAGARARDTIAAIATARGRAGIGVVRVSGPDVARVAVHVLGALPEPRRAVVRDFRGHGAEVVDRGVVLYFAAPGSYTGEDVLELQAHGGSAVLNALLEAVLALGVRHARPGEFTERAFLEGRLDLAQAEAVADLIDATSARAARAARATLRGEFSRHVNGLAEAMMRLRVMLEAELDFAEEDIDVTSTAATAAALDRLGGETDAVLAAAGQGVRLNDGVRAVLVGAPNVGKSSILNRLAGDERAIVTSVPGTTRDLIRQEVWLEGMHLELVDTAGLRDSADEVERAGMQRTRDAAQEADLLLVVLDDSDPDAVPPPGLGAGARRVTVRNKIDASGAAPGTTGDEARVSARTGAGFSELVQLLAARADALAGEGAFTARRRHVDALARARAALAEAVRLHGDDAGQELVAEALRAAHAALGEITGAVCSDDLLGAIFATFCIGK
jgi:tRNA modification GTPase